MRTLLLSALFTFIAAELAASDAIPVPSVTRIDYSQPEKYLTLHESFGDAARIRAVAEGLKAKTPERTLSAINAWIGKNLQYDDSCAYAWRNFDTAVDTGRLGSCADNALVFAALARACGIPAVLVKTMDVPWIYEFRQTGTCSTWSGHVFLEVYLDGRWQLFDAQAMMLYDHYDPTQGIMPGNRYAYDKGSDPRELLLSLDWDRWKKQTAAYFSKIDLSELPVGPGRYVASPDDVFIAANSPVWQALTERCQALGYSVRASFNTDFDQKLSAAKGGRLIITCVGDQIVLPEERRAEFLPVTGDELHGRIGRGESGMIERSLDDGTRVLLIYAKDNDAMLELVKTLLIPKNS